MVDDQSDETQISVTVGTAEQTLVYFPGDGMALVLGDDMDADSLRNYLPAPVARAVLAARLQAFADMLCEPEVVSA